MKLPETKSINLAISKIIFYLLLFFTISCKNGLPVNVFDPESFLGFLVGLDPWRYNPPPKSKIKILGAVSSISEGETIQVGVVLENNTN